MKKYYKFLLLPLGALAGYSYYYFIGCNSGSCPIQSNPYISTLYGTIVAAVFLIPTNAKKKQ